MSDENNNNENNENQPNKENNSSSDENQNRNEENNSSENSRSNKPNKDNSNNNDEFRSLKEKLDKVYEDRDRLKAELEKVANEKREAEIARLKEEGKEKEAFEMQLAEKDRIIEEKDKEIVRLTRDNTVRHSLTGYDFRNEKASDLAFESIIKELVQDEKGNWVHRSGRSVAEFIETFSKDSDNEFLFKPQENRGSGIDRTAENANDSGNGNAPKGYRSRSQADLIKDIKAGKVKL